MGNDLLLEKKPAEIRAEFYGATEFRIGSSAPKIAADIVIGYKKVTINGKPERTIYASFAASDNKDITLAQLITACGGETSAIPSPLVDCVGFRSFAISYGASVNTKNFTITLETRIRIDGIYPDTKDTSLDATITIDYKRTDDKPEFTFGGILKVGASHRFDIVFHKTENIWYLFAAYRHKKKTSTGPGAEITIDLGDIASEIFGGDMKGKVPDVSFKLTDFKAFILYRKEKNNSALLFGMGAGLNLSLNDLPMAGPILAHDRSFAFEEVLAFYSSGAFTKAELAKFPGTPAIEIYKGFNISISLRINNEASCYGLNGGANEKYQADTETATPATIESISGETSAKAKWAKVDKKLGPVQIQRLGFLYNKGKVVLLLDAGLETAGMGMQLMGLGLGFKLEWSPKMPEFYIDGLGLSYTRDPVRISGMFTRVQPKETEVYAYYGSAQLSFSKFNISGIGAYSKLKRQGDISLFIYALYQGAIGGPAFFFVTGIAAGFGYNRKVRVPKIAEVNTFPLVAMALNPAPAKSLNVILAELIAKDCIPTSPGDYWLAVGVKFTSFKIIESFVLAIAQFGTHTEFSILGLSILAWPNKEKPIAYVELALKANFGPHTDLLSVEAMLTPNSYVLDKNCKLTGGFAFYAWVSGPHEGDFVITLGGYHPKFVKPAHYPDVQRLGLNWRLSSELQIKGGLYYALTPSCVMAGGRLEITYTLSFLRASIVVWADMLIAWAPFYYAIDIGISVQIEANIDMGLFYVRFNLEMGAQLHIWGPPFAGTVYVDWSIFAFTIPFGEGAVNKNYLSWPDFQKQFLPSKKAEEKLLNNGKPPEDIYPAAEIIIASGIITQTESYIIVNPHKLNIKIEASAPVINAKIEGAEIADDTVMEATEKGLKYQDRNRALGIRPINARQLLSVLSINIDQHTAFICTAYAGSVPEALWSPTENKNNNNSPGASKVLQRVMKGIALSSKKQPEPQGSPQFDLDGKFTVVKKILNWTYIAAKTGPDNESYTRKIKDIIIEALNEQGTTRKRNSIIENAIKAQGITETDATVSGNINEWVEGLQAEPVIVQVGGLPQYKDK